MIRYLSASKYNAKEIEFLGDGFKHGFDIGYQGPMQCSSKSSNIPLKVGSPVELWNKLIKEVKAKRVVGPFDNIPFDNYIQSPIGLVPKDGGSQTHLIFHLSFDFGKQEDQRSLNYHTPEELCSVCYQDLDCAARTCLEVRHLNLKYGNLFWVTNEDSNDGIIYIDKTDIKSAFHLLPLKKSSYNWVVMKAVNPMTGKTQYFVDKCLPFGASISCAHFQRFSNALKHLVQFRTVMNTVNNYLDDFLFTAATLLLCNYFISEFLQLCLELGIPIVKDKTVWATLRLVFLGILLDCTNMTLVIPEEKRIHAIYLIKSMLDKRKATVRELQQLCGYLNFLNRAVIPGRAFTRRMYAKFSQQIHLSKVGYKSDPSDTERSCGHKKLMPHHHIRFDCEFKLDCKIWLEFLTDEDLKQVVSRPMLDVSEKITSRDICFYSDASRNGKLGMGCILKDHWIYA